MQYVPPIGGASNDPYLDANPATGVEGSPVPAAAIEHPMREIMSVITAAGLAPASGDLTQLQQAIAKMILDGGGDYKASCRVATTANLAALTGLLTIDGIVLVAGDRVLVKDQAAGAQNGIYVAAAGAWSRATDADVGTELNSGAIVPVEEGTANADTQWMLTTDGTITIGTTALTFALNAGGNKFVKKGGDTLLGALSLFGGDTGVTPPQFDASTKLATDAFVKRVGLEFSRTINTSGVTYILTAADAGSVVVIGNATTTVVLPDLATFPDGAAIDLVWASGATVQRAGANQIIMDNSSNIVNSVVGNVGDTLRIVSYAANSYWLAESGSLKLKYAGVFGSLLASNGYQKFPSGAIIQWGTATTSGSADVTITYPIAFPNGSIVVCDEYEVTTSSSIVVSLAAVTTANFKVGTYTSNTAARIAKSVNWLAIGW